MVDQKILVTGATGNVGKSLLEYLVAQKAPVVAGTRNSNPNSTANIEYVEFDLKRPETYHKALLGVERVFLVRPPAIAKVNRDIKPFIQECVRKKIKHVVFLSLMGIEKNPVPPHHKIERLIRQTGIPYTFMRPSFFMQNLSTTHCLDIREDDDIFVPAGKARVSFVDTRDIGEACGIALTTHDHYNKAYTLTGPEAITYEEVAQVFSGVLQRPIAYSNPSPFHFRKVMLARGIPKNFVNVMVALYVTTRMGMAKTVTPDLASLLGRRPRSIVEYVEDHKHYWL